MGGGDPGWVAPAPAAPGRRSPPAEARAQRSSHQTDFSSRPAVIPHDDEMAATMLSPRPAGASGSAKVGTGQRSGRASKTARVTLSGVTSIWKRPSPTCCSALLDELARGQGGGGAHRGRAPGHLRGDLPPDEGRADRSGGERDPLLGVAEVGDPVAPAQQVGGRGGADRVDEHDHLDRREPEDLMGQPPEVLLGGRARVHHDHPISPEAELVVDGGAVQRDQRRPGARDGREVATGHDHAHGQGPSSLSAPAASSSVTRRNRRETCICEMPTRAAI